MPILNIALGVAAGVALIGAAIYLALRPYLNGSAKSWMPDATDEFKDRHLGD